MIDQTFAEKVVVWFRENGRVLPWRVGRDPYRIWISEVMLQQTRIEAVIPYYHRFLSAFPDVKALAAASEDEVLKYWEGLGYYSRARNLKRAAEMICTDYDGKMPSTFRALRALPGIGDYTAGAISSIAFGLSHPAVDGNVLRVMARYQGDARDIMLPQIKKSVEEELSLVYPVGAAAGDLTEGIMEIGERICIPNGMPLCSICPLKEKCVAYRQGTVLSLPVKTGKKERRIEEKTVLILSCGENFAIRKREETGLLAGMWEFVSVSGKKTADEIYRFLSENGFSPVSVSPVGTAKHIFTHLEWHMTGYFAQCEKKPEGLVWLPAETILKEYAIPTAFRAFLKKLSQE